MKNICINLTQEQEITQNTTHDTGENVTLINKSVKVFEWIQEEIQKLATAISNNFDETNWLCGQTLVLLGTSIVCATFLVLVLDYLRSRKPIPKYEILLATVLKPNSTPEDVAVNCTLGAFSVGMKTNLNHPEVLDMWKKSGSQKKVVAVDNEDILQELQMLAEVKNIVNVLIRDVPTSSHTNTTLAVGPALPQELAAFACFGRMIGQSKI